MNTLALFLGTLLTCLVSAHATYWLTHQKKWSSIRAGSFASLVFIAIAALSHSSFLLSLQAAFFGSTFTAMSEPHRLSEKKVLIASLVFGAILFTLQTFEFTHFHGGLGGTLGGAAFVACLIVYWGERLVPKN